MKRVRFDLLFFRVLRDLAKPYLLPLRVAFTLAKLFAKLQRFLGLLGLAKPTEHL